MKLFHRATLISVVCAAVTLTGVGAANAATVAPRPAAISTSTEVSHEQIDELARYLEAIHEGELRSADGSFDRTAAVSLFGAEFADAVETELSERQVASAGAKSTLSAKAAKGKDSYGKCLLKAVGLGGLGGATSAIMNKLSEKKWSDAARLITKEAAKRGVKIAVKGGVVGLAASLAASAIWCATPWA